MVIGIVDLGDGTGALPSIPLKISDNFDSAVNSMTSLLALLLIVFLAIVVGSIVTARFRPLHAFISHPGFAGSEETDR